MKKIIVPTDFSENAKHALTQAIQFFQYEYCEFYIIHAYAEETYDDNAHLDRALFNDVKELVKARSNEKLIELLEYAQDISPNLKHHFKIRSVFQLLIDAIDDTVNQEEADIVVMGTKGATNDPKITFGSKTIQVMRYVECPVLSIPETYEFKRPENILFPTNFLVPYSRRELKLLDYLGSDFKSTIHILYKTAYRSLSLRKEDNKLFLQESLNNCKQEMHYVKGDDLIETINNFIESNQIDLLVMVNTRESYLESLFQKTTIDKIELNSKIPFVVMQNIDRCSY